MADLLGDLAELRRRAREDRHAYPSPLLVLGGITPATTSSMAGVVVLPGFVLVVGGLVGLRRG
jgi:hypothetical protein